jgi:hypothetical protein
LINSCLSTDEGTVYAIKTLCAKTLENGGRINRYLWGDAFITLGSDDLGRVD